MMCLYLSKSFFHPLVKICFSFLISERILVVCPGKRKRLYPGYETDRVKTGTFTPALVRCQIFKQQ